DSLWMCGSTKIINGFEYGIMFKTTNGGNIWGYQMADTSIKLMAYAYIDFLNKHIGWSYRPITSGVHTLVGGNDTTFFTGMKLVENFVPSGYTLGQNYPNPFNPSTNIPFELNESGYIVLKVYDITGRTIKELVNGRWGKGRYILDFDGTNLPSGIYFYRIEITGQSTKEKFIDSKKMMLLK
ncbi:MAG TPA: T9SS type A sorting domain-containing protein, partial [Ignavibacteria bacterium]